jgi:hypothetical protein
MAFLAAKYMLPFGGSRTEREYRDEWTNKNLPPMQWILREQPESSWSSDLIYRFPFALHRNDHSTKVILYSHGNMSIVPWIWERLMTLGERLGVSVCAYEYDGYYNRNNTSIDLVNANSLATYEYLLQHGYKPEDIILWGRSIGSGPTVWLASTVKRLYNHQVGGVVLITPFESISEMASLFLHPFVAVVSNYILRDVYNNAKLIQDVQSKVCIIGAANDEVIPIQQAKNLSQVTTDCILHVLKEHTHNTIDEPNLLYLDGIKRLF